jgi:hypothetical protein
MALAYNSGRMRPFNQPNFTELENSKNSTV